jgi:bacteriorhodopsin
MGHSSDASMRLQTLQPKFHLRIAAIFILAIVFLSFLGFTKHGAFRAYYGGIAFLAAVALIVQYRRERTIVHNRLSAVGVVTE